MPLQATQPSSLQLVDRLLDEVKTFKPTLAINNGDISYARCACKQLPKILTDFHGNSGWLIVDAYLRGG